MPAEHACCAPSAHRAPLAIGAPGNRTTPARGMVRLPGGEFVMGHDGPDGYPEDGEGPAHPVTLGPFWIDPVAVSNERFGAFVDATGYRTEAETYGWSFVFAGLLPDDFPPTRGVEQTPWWRQVEGADWRHPEGPQSDVHVRADHPAVHVSWTDAVAYTVWAGVRLPTEAEWECAARGGLAGSHYPWGDEREPGGAHRMNVWQGTFPSANTGADGFVGTAPVDAYEPNGFGLYNTTGNVWEWCADWFARDAYRTPGTPAPSGLRVMRGGSYLCHESYCFRYRVDSRSSSTPDSSAGNVGFRCASDA
ncbi:formylglycine-generating enzyme family protein [Cellulomonas sp. ICMP 17802]|uniref:formylglycine-generating enzyme family protein n=1 Tax=Cellulomonas sp. ICMP 17802 TaxID=3239199 RepID=UPI00351AF655